VVETTAVPRTRIAANGMFIPVGDGRTEPIGQRIIDVPENTERTEVFDPRSGFIAYAPVGSLKKGEALVTTGGGKTTPSGVPGSYGQPTTSFPRVLQLGFRFAF
jgi:hypothetical protein